MEKPKIDVRWKQRFANYKKALSQLTAQIEKVPDPSAADDTSILATIQAFEFTFELAWQTLKDFLEDQGFKDLYGSKNTIRRAFERGLLTEGQKWMDMIDSRNNSTHTYDEDTAGTIYADIRNVYYPKFLELKEKLESL
jgi:nucleotidyltransferase substrate binding protein (TIGR01987 family)